MLRQRGRIPEPSEVYLITGAILLMVGIILSEINVEFEGGNVSVDRIYLIIGGITMMIVSILTALYTPE